LRSLRAKNNEWEILDFSTLPVLIEENGNQFIAKLKETNEND